jgi:hypothetical protein
MTGKCPICKQTVGQLNGEQIDINLNNQVMGGIVYVCPSCAAILGCGLNPNYQQDALVRELLKELRNRGLIR